MSRAKRLILFSGICLIAVLCVSIFIRSSYVAVILMYHSVNPEAQPQKRTELTVDMFKRQMEFLKQRRYNVIPLESLALLIKEKKKIPPKTLAITFDDGYKDNYVYAFKILKKYNLPATIFIIFNEVGRPDRLSWQEIKEMLSSGLISVGSHCLGPEPLVNIKSEEKLKKEIFDSKRLLEQRLGRRIGAFSYPGGMFNRQIKQLVTDAGYSLAVATSPGKESANNDLFALKRIRISATARNLAVFWLQTSGIYTFIKEHRLGHH